jgi:mono/diheme cytochrome c family protein
MRRNSMAVMTVLAVSFAGSAFAADAAKGKEVFDAAKPACKMCHTDAKHPLKEAAGKKPDELKAWVRTPKDMLTKAGKTGAMPVYGADKISDADLDNLVAYIASLK